VGALPLVLRPRAWPPFCAFALALVLWAGLADGLLRMPLQVSDSLEEILEARRSPGAWHSFVHGLTTSSYLRPLRIVETKLIFDASAGHYVAAYRGFHAALLLAAFVLLTRAFRVRDGTDLAAAAFALTVFTGHHTFDGMLREAFPINHFLQVTVLCLAAANLVQARPRWWIDVAANLVLVAACLTMESGVLVWVVLVGGRLAGWMGVSRAGIAVATAIVVAYLLVRTAWLHEQFDAMGAASGFLLDALEPQEIEARFRGRLPLFYGYTVLAQLGSVLFGEPRHGIWLLARSLIMGDVPPRQLITVATSVITTVLMIKAARSLTRGRPLAVDARYYLLFAAILAANAVVSFAYAKEEIISVAGSFYALAAYAAVRGLIASARPPSTLVAAMLVVAASGWAFRSLGVHHVLRSQAFNHRNDWATVAHFLRQREQWPSDAEGQRLVLRLQADALATPVPNPWLTGRWADRVFDVD
jgi:hypothetical protein